MKFQFDNLNIYIILTIIGILLLLLSLWTIKKTFFNLLISGYIFLVLSFLLAIIQIINKLSLNLNYKSFYESFFNITSIIFPLLLIICFITTLISLTFFYKIKIITNNISSIYNLFSNLSTYIILLQTLVIFFNIINLNNVYNLPSNILHLLNILNFICIINIYIVLEHYSTDG